MTITDLYTSMEGRISRAPYWLGTLPLIGASILVYVAAARASGGFDAQQSLKVRAIVFAADLLLAYPWLALMTKRLHDRNYSARAAVFFAGFTVLVSLTELAGWGPKPGRETAFDLALALVVLVVVVAFVVELGFRRGTRGPNGFGPDPIGSRD